MIFRGVPVKKTTLNFCQKRESAIGCFVAFTVLTSSVGQKRWFADISNVILPAKDWWIQSVFTPFPPCEDGSDISRQAVVGHFWWVTRVWFLPKSTFWQRIIDKELLLREAMCAGNIKFVHLFWNMWATSNLPLKEIYFILTNLLYILTVFWILFTIFCTGSLASCNEIYQNIETLNPWVTPRFSSKGV